MARRGAAAVLALLLCSCATTSLAYREPTAADRGLANAALLVLRVVIETTDARFADEKGILRDVYPVLHVLLEDSDGGQGYRTLDIDLPMQPSDWRPLDGRYRYSRDVLAKVPFGAYLLRGYELYLGTTYGASSKTTHFWLWYPRIGFAVSEPRAYAMGALLLDIDSIVGTSFDDLRISSRLSLDQGADAIAANAAAIDERNPSLAVGLQPLAVRYAYSLLTPRVHSDVLDRREDALWPDTSSDRIEAGFEGSSFYLRKKVSDDMFDWVRPVTIQPLPESYDVEWDARLINGESEKRFGLMLGKDEKNCFVFSASGSGSAAVLRIIDGSWQKRVLEPVPSAARTMQSGEASRFLVSVRGNRVRFSVDGKQLVEFTSAIDLSQAFVAPILESRGILSISRFLVTGAP